MKINIKSLCSSLAALVALGIMVLPQVAAATVTNQSLAIPMFQNPTKGTFWNDVAAVGSSSVPFVVANPRNGPGTVAEDAYTNVIANAASNGTRTLGYVQTNFQARPYKDVQADTDGWYRVYPNTRGIYVDLVKEGQAEDVCYVSALYSHIKNNHPNDLVVLGAGNHISQAYEPYGDIFLNAQSDFGSYQNWTTQYKGFEDKASYQNRFWHVIYNTTSDNYSNAFTMARNNNSGWVYITDQKAPTPFFAAPSYWQTEKDDVNALPSSSIPNRGLTTLPRGCISLSSSADSTIDTTALKQTTVTSNITVNNTSTLYDSEPATKMQVLSTPTGASLQSIAGTNWSCDVNAKSCSYGGTLPAVTSTGLASVMKADCTYNKGNAKLRLTNYTGNRWDLDVPIQPPAGCDASTPAGKVNASGTGQVVQLTTQSVETTPQIKALGEENTPTQQQKTLQPTKKGPSAIKIVAIVVIVAILIGAAVSGGWYWYQHRNPYRIR
jgi:hypothetical protein